MVSHFIIIFELNSLTDALRLPLEAHTRPLQRLQENGD